MNEVRLTHRGLSRLGSDRDFELKTDDQKDTIVCSRSQVLFISPVIHKLMLIDSTINEFKLKTPNSSRCSGILRDLLEGSIVSVTSDLNAIFYSIAAELGNDELFFCIEEDLTLENVIEILKIKHQGSLNIEKEVKFVASHFYELPEEEIGFLDISIIDSIISSEFLVIKTEESLLEFIKSLIAVRGDDYKSLLCHLHLEYLKTDDISYIINMIDVDNIGSFLPRIFDRLVLPLSKFKIDRNRIKNAYVPYKNDIYDGIFSYLWRKVGGNPVTKGAVSIEETTNRAQDRVSYLIDQRFRLYLLYNEVNNL